MSGRLTRAVRGAQKLNQELEDCIAEFMWASMVFYRQWGVQARDLVLRPPEWCAPSSPRPSPHALRHVQCARQSGASLPPLPGSRHLPGRVPCVMILDRISHALSSQCVP